jgi:hypothetical protein
MKQVFHSRIIFSIFMVFEILFLTGMVLVFASFSPMIHAQTSGDPLKQIKSDSPILLSFDSMFKKPIGPAGLEISPVLMQADGKTVTLQGYMVLQETLAQGRFMFAQRPVQMSEHADGEADDLPPSVVMVMLPKPFEQSLVPHQHGIIALTGDLKVGRYEAADGRIVWLRLMLKPDALSTMSAEQWQATMSAHHH